jgi:hypothetical protein
MKTLIDKQEIDVDGLPMTYYDLACDCGYLCEGFPKKSLAEDRKRQHLEEHETGEPAPPVGDLLATTSDRSAADGIALALAKRRRA